MSQVDNGKDQSAETQGKKKLSMQELVKQQLERKKQAQGNGNNQSGMVNTNQRMRSQQSGRKPSNTRRKMGS